MKTAEEVREIAIDFVYYFSINYTEWLKTNCGNLKTFYDKFLEERI